MEIDMPSNFDALPLADRYAILKAEADALAKQIDALKAEIKATGLETVEGDNVVIKVCLSERSTLDTASVKKILTPDQVAACSKVSLVETLRIQPRMSMVA
jgi:hypothetical protein